MSSLETWVFGFLIGSVMLCAASSPTILRTDTSAFCDVGLTYAHHIPLPDKNRAIYWLQKGADRGDKYCAQGLQYWVSEWSRSESQQTGQTATNGMFGVQGAGADCRSADGTTNWTCVGLSSDRALHIGTFAPNYQYGSNTIGRKIEFGGALAISRTQFAGGKDSRRGLAQTVTMLS
jgi:hypothetical protein